MSLPQQVHIINCLSTYDLETNINEYLEKGWELLGDMKIIQQQKLGGAETRFLQQMVYNKIPMPLRENYDHQRNL